ncbi:MAG TPA: SDR family oxidoreductase [Bryobacteraceae bacterium]|nr:SDR family oxidoreductase [Bryobacteraceae bacterium]
MGRLNGTTSIVTGASRGIGCGIAKRFAAEGSRVVLSARDQGLLDQAVGDIRAAGGTASAISLDLCLAGAPQRLVDFAVKEYGGFDIVVNNAGATKRGKFLELSDAEFADGFALKYFGAMRVSRAAWPHLKASRGSLLFISGAGGRTPGAEFSIGGSVNAALLSLTKALAELGIEDGVQVNCINPGSVRTARYTVRLNALAKQLGLEPADAEAEYVREHRVTRIGEVEDIAALAAFVVSAEGRLLQGSLIDMDAGSTKTI